ncbi:MAG: MATE family efflux transporter [Lachnospiraceae bacterium]|nr:MATE family efflux transporter [Lachnospiraceae bacterium]
MEETKSNSYFETAPIGRLIARFAIPSIISLVVNALYNIVDQIFIGNGVGYLGNGATTVVFPITVVATALALLIGDGGAAYLSLRLGEGNSERATKGVGNSIVMLVSAGILLLAIALIFLKPLLVLFGGTEAIMPYALAYGKIISIGLPFVVISTGLNSIIRADGNPKMSMVSMILGAVINTILDPVFIFVFKWGVEGAALATILGQIVSFVISAIYIRKLRSVKLTRDSFRLDANTLRSCSGLGISSFITQIAIVIMSILCNVLLAKYGALTEYGSDIPITVLGIVMKVNQILIAILIGISSGAQPILGYNYGARNMKRVKKTYGIMLIASAVVSVAAFIMFQCFPQSIINLFGSESDLYNQFALKAFHIFLLMCIASAYQVTSSIFLQAIGKPIPSMVSALLRQLIIFVPAAIILPTLMGIDGILWAMPIADLSSAVITLFMIIYAMKEINQQEHYQGGKK